MQNTCPNAKSVCTMILLTELKAFTHHAEGNQTWHICGVLVSYQAVSFSHWWCRVWPLAIRWANVQTMKFTWSTDWHRWIWQSSRITY